MEENERVALCALNAIFGFEPHAAHALLEVFGSGSAVFDAGMDSLQRALPYCDKLRSITPSRLKWGRQELERLDSLPGGDHYTFVPFGDECYPELLAQSEDAPLGLYVRSNRPLTEVFDSRPNIAIVGTRDISSYGREWTKEIVRALAASEHPPRIISGLALGTDITAHVEALERGLPTIAIMATGVDRVYPYAHSGWAGRIADADGSALISDYPLETAPLQINFMRRNRIIAALSRSTIVVESKSKGGSLITARLAFDYSRDVYALPGRIDDVRSQGCNYLIRSQMASAIDSLEGLVEALGLGRGSGGSIMREDLATRIDRIYSTDTLSMHQIAAIKKVAECIKSNRGAQSEEISSITGLPGYEVLSILAMLESDGIVSVDVLGRCSIRL